MSETEKQKIEQQGVLEEPKTKKRKSGKILRIFLGIIVLFVIIFIMALVFLGTIIRTSVEKVGSMVTGCQIKVEKLDLRLFKGQLELADMSVGNPEGFKTDTAFKVSRIYVKLEPKSVFSDKIIVSEVLIENPEVTYELNPLKFESNVGVIQKNVQSFLPENKDKQPKEKKVEEGGKKVEISHVQVSGGKIRLAATIGGNNALPIPLPGVELNDIGKEKEVSTLEASAMVLSETLSSCLSVVKDSATSIGKGIGEGASKTGKAIGEGASEAVKAIGNLFKK